jgi:hypothetical protein
VAQRDFLEGMEMLLYRLSIGMDGRMGKGENESGYTDSTRLSLIISIPYGIEIDIDGQLLPNLYPHHVRSTLILRRLKGMNPSIYN